MRRTYAAAALILSSMLSASAHADSHGDFGLGLTVGRPTGITGEYWLSDANAIDMAIGIDLFRGRDLYAHADFLFVLPDLLHGGSVELLPYLGPGGYIVVDNKGNDVGLGARVPFGLSLDFTTAPLQLFIEAAVSLSLVPDVKLGVGGALGFRYYF